MADNATPAAKEYADQHGISISEVKGSGDHGKVTKADVEAHVSGGSAGEQVREADVAASDEPKANDGPDAETAAEVAGESGDEKYVEFNPALSMERLVHEGKVYTQGDEISDADYQALRDLKTDGEYVLARDGEEA